MIEKAPAGEIRDTRLADALSERYLSYALSTITSRSLPDVRDGLKPVHRRLLYAMRQLKLEPSAGFKKCARVVGDVIGKYHPHGDGAVYDTLVRLAQDFAQRYTLVDGQGNFGNIDGDNAAAMRYTEARLTEVAWALLEGIDQDAVDFRDTYDGEDEEPVVLPSAFPNLLANGSAGIAVGMATSIPPHNAGELCDAFKHLIKFPNAGFDKLVEFVPGPDFPTGGTLVETRETIIESYRTGRGSFRVRAKWEIEDLGRGTYQIVITEIPYQVQKSRLIEKIAELLIAKKLPLLADIRDESTELVRVVLEPKSKNIDAEHLMEHLFRQTELESRFSLNMNVLGADHTPRVMNLREAMQAFLDHRQDVLMRVTRHRLGKIERRLEMLGGFLIAYLNLDEVIRIIREEDDAKQTLMARFELTEPQAEGILNMRLRQLRKLEEIEIRKEHDGLTAEQLTLDSLLTDVDRQWKIISDEFTEIKAKFGQKTVIGKRRTEIGSAPSAVIVPIESLIEKEPITIILSEKDWIRAVKGHAETPEDMKFKDGDKHRFAIHAETTDKLVVFATNGRFYTLGCDKLPGGRGHGEPLRLMIDLANGYDVVDIFVLKGGRRAIVASDAGRGFVVEEDSLIAQTRNGKQVLNLKANEEARCLVFIAEGHDHVAVLGSKRKLLIFPLDELPVMTRGQGVILQRYKQGGLADINTLRRDEGLTWKTAGGVRTETDIDEWIGKRAQAGQLPFKGFPKSNSFK
ncbi:MAG: DNA topoisomerase IV subunit A [Rhodospirillales bacterium]|nr:DNA topoisomerase IV subunit A [Rhodospirillales bacterium]